MDNFSAGARARTSTEAGTDRRVAAVCETATKPLESQPVLEQANLARQEKACLDVVDMALTTYQNRLAPAGATLETSVNAAMLASDLAPAEADLHRDVLIDLAHRFAQPGERVLGVGLMPYLQPAEVVVVLTHGFAVKTRSSTFRVELDRETPSTAAEFGLHGLTLTTHTSLGDLHYYDGELLTPEGGRLPRFYLALRTQELSPGRPSKRFLKARIALRKKITTLRREPVFS